MGHVYLMTDKDEQTVSYQLLPTILHWMISNIFDIQQVILNRTKYLISGVEGNSFVFQTIPVFLEAKFRATSGFKEKRSSAGFPKLYKAPVINQPIRGALLK